MKRRPVSKIGEWVLGQLSNDEQESGAALPEWPRGRELSKICRHIPWFPVMIQGARVLDVGSGSGYQAARIAELGASDVVGVEIRPELRCRARQVAEGYGVLEKVSYLPELTEELEGTFDVVLSQNSFEHFSKPLMVLETMGRALTPHGRAVIVFGPLWWHPYGSHMHFFTRVPWLQLWFSEDTIMSVRAQYRDDGAEHFTEVSGGLNKMTVRRFQRLVNEAGMVFDYFKVEAPNGLGSMVRIPILRELFAKDIYAILRPRKTSG